MRFFFAGTESRRSLVQSDYLGNSGVARVVDRICHYRISNLCSFDQWRRYAAFANTMVLLTLIYRFLGLFEAKSLNDDLARTASNPTYRSGSYGRYRFDDFDYFWNCA